MMVLTVSPTGTCPQGLTFFYSRFVLSMLEPLEGQFEAIHFIMFVQQRRAWAIASGSTSVEIQMF